MGQFCDIKSRDDLAAFLDIPVTKINYLLYRKGIDNCYNTFEIPKRTGGTRQIAAPIKDLQEVQSKLSNALIAYQEQIWKESGIVPTLSHGFQKGKGILSNAKIHRNKRFVLNYDLADFFPSIHFGRIVGFFERHNKFRLPYKVAVVLAQLTCYQSTLPQGAPTSPIISNLICQVLDIRLLKLSKEYKLDYTRYADDLTFSTNNKYPLEKLDEFEQELSAIVAKTGFALNISKTRLQYKDSRQCVTGLIVNKKLNVDRRFYKETRAMAHTLYTMGQFRINGQPGTLQQLEGRFSFIDQVEHYNNKLDNRAHNQHNLSAREAQYQKFLFYRYFYANPKPVIITEGKTDILYIKAALLVYADKYPSLIRQENNKFIFQIQFFNKTKRWKYFYGISLDGGDTMQNIYSFYVDGHNCPNYWKYFHKQNPAMEQHPVILLFDNESVSQKPLCKFLRTIKASEANKAALQKDLYIPLGCKTNLFLLTNPLVDDKKECEIEDLFPEETLNHTINGKHFHRDITCKGTDTYSKDVFSKYIYSNRNTINLSGFLPLLDTLSKIVTTYQNPQKD